MREIKFRAWDKKAKYMRDIRLFDSNEHLNPDNYIIMQYTGLKDKNGIEIYERDMFGIMGGDEEKPHEYEVHGQVEYDNDFAMFIIVLTNGGWMQLYDYMNSKTKAREIIGNIYQNPELLNK